MLDSTVTSYFITACHGQKHCNLTANPHALEVDGCSELYVYLKTVYACVDMRAIQDDFVDCITILLDLFLLGFFKFLI